MNAPGRPPRDWFRFCPHCGAPSGAGLADHAREHGNGATPFSCKECSFTYYFNATVAAAAFLKRPDGRMLFVRRAREPRRGWLAPPGGFIDIGECAEDALRREVREEVGLEIDGPNFLASFPNAYEYRGVVYPVLDLYFVADAVEFEHARALDDAEAICWRDPSSELDPEELAFPSARAALEVLRRELGMERGIRVPSAAGSAGGEGAAAGAGTGRKSDDGGQR